MDKLLIVLFKFIGISLGFLIIIVITKTFGQKTYGIFSYYFSLMQIFSIFLLYGSEIKIFRLKIRKDFIYENVIYIFFRFFFLLLISFILFGELYFFAVVASLFLSLRIINSIILRIQKKIIVYSLIEFVLLNICFIILLHSNIKLVNISQMVIIEHIVSIIIVFIISLIFTNFYIFKYDILNYVNKYFFKNFFIIFAKDFKILLPSLLWILEENIDIFIIKIFFNYKLVGIYAILLKLSFIIYLPLIVLNNAFLSNITQKTFSSIRKFSFILGIILFILLFLLKGIIFQYFSIEKKFTLLYIMILLSFLISSFFGVSYSLAQLKIKDFIIIKIMLVALLFNIIVPLLLYNFLGLYSIVIAKMGALFLMSYLFYRNLKCYL